MTWPLYQVESWRTRALRVGVIFILLDSLYTALKLIIYTFVYSALQEGPSSSPMRRVTDGKRSQEWAPCQDRS